MLYIRLVIQLCSQMSRGDLTPDIYTYTWYGYMLHFNEIPVEYTDISAKHR